jgi:V-type H+-transporting ATPase subunit E
MADQSHAVENMVGFITAEAKEKANEIEREAQETYTIEKQRMIESEKKKIRGDFERKEKQVSVEKRIKASNLAKDQRLRVLKERDALIKEMMALARQKMVALTSSPKYSEVLTNLIAQGADEQKCSGAFTVQCLAKDKAAVTSCLQAAAAKVKSASGRDVTLSLDSQALPAEDIGGVVVVSADGRIKTVNTFSSREEGVCVDLLPRFRKLMFNN